MSADDVRTGGKVSDPASGLRLPLPAGWSRVDGPPGHVTIAADRAWSAGGAEVRFRPTVTASRVPLAPGVDAAALGTAALAGALASVEDGRVLAYDVSADDPATGPLTGRRLLFAHRQGRATIAVLQAVTVVDGHGVTVTASFPLLQWAALRPLVGAVVDGVRADAPTAAEVPAAGEPAEGPRRDPWFAARGEDLEDLARVAEAQPAPAAGLRLSRAAFDHLAGARRRVAPEFRDELVAAGLLRAGGRPSEDGAGLVALARERTGHLRLESARGAAPLALDVSLHGADALVVTTAAPGELPADPRGGELRDAAGVVTVDVVDASLLPVVLAGFVGLGPAWSAGGAVELPQDLLARRAADPRTPPPADADAALLRAWAQPWFLCTLHADGLDADRLLLNAGAAGTYVVRTQGEGPASVARLQPVPSALLFEDLVRICDAVVDRAQLSPR
ncbi:hypothetical protein [Kineococcus rubinsiae]|uniref:hypothetical protein n=1 Tax=Kineococcus rubinsiae TaxID=2609562 RepID=UPI001430C0BC|nr:hypothetical protein [Kineococcus rubinsiae]NIZ91912.1 hypothetical protein [Kineococcus rubinsiae]